MSCRLPWFKFRSAAPEEYEVHALCAQLGPEADAYLFRLWAYCGRERVSGRFPGPGAELAVERAVRWRGKRGRLVAALLSVGLLVREGEDLVVASWQEEQGAHVAKVVRDAAKPSGSAAESPEMPARLPPTSLPSPARDVGGENGEKREEKTTSQGRKADETPSRARQDETPSQPPRKAKGEVAPRERPAQPPPTSRAGDEALPDGIQREYREARDAEYTWRLGRDDPASRTLLSLAGEAGAPEVLRRWRNGVRARFKQRCDTLPDLVKRWEANATPEDGDRPRAPLAAAEPLPLPYLPDTPAGRLWGQGLEALRAQGLRYIAEQLQRKGQPLSVDEGHLVVELPDRYALSWVEDTCERALQVLETTLGQPVKFTTSSPLEAHGGAA